MKDPCFDQLGNLEKNYIPGLPFLSLFLVYQIGMYFESGQKYMLAARPVLGYGLFRSLVWFALVRL